MTDLENVGNNKSWIIIGSNWRAETECDSFNSQFEKERIAEEMATRAIESLQGKENGILLNLEEGQETLELGGIVLAHEKESSPDKGFILFVAELLANAGYYKESVDVAEKTAKVLKEETDKRVSEKNSKDKPKRKSRKKAEKAESIEESPVPPVKKPRKPRTKKKKKT